MECKCGHSEAQHTTDLAQCHPSNPHVMLCNIAACACNGFRPAATTVRKADEGLVKTKAQQRFDRLFYDIPGSWAGCGPSGPGDTAHVVVDAHKLHDALVFLVRHRCRIQDVNEPKAGWAAGGKSIDFSVLR